MNIKIYQINLGRDEKRKAFFGLDDIERLCGSREIDSAIYDCVFDGEVECNGLEEVFGTFNLEHPEGYKGRSLSVSDIVEVVRDENVTPGFYYCDSVGFKPVDFGPEKAEKIEEKQVKMKEYRVTITETLKKNVFVEAESQLEAEQKVSDAWRNGEHILDADCFEDVDFTVENTDPHVEMRYAELSALFRSVNGKRLDAITGYIVFTEDSFDKFYGEESRTYVVSSNNKAYQSGMGGYSIYGSCLDGTDPCIRLEGYMRGENAWKIEKCYMLKDDYDRLLTQLEPFTKPPQGREER